MLETRNIRRIVGIIDDLRIYLGNWMSIEVKLYFFKKENQRELSEWKIMSINQEF